jgi:squalene-hopene/tetraprenyl-beta-curcumene cyclase
MGGDAAMATSPSLNDKSATAPSRLESFGKHLSRDDNTELLARVDTVVEDATQSLKQRQASDGHWVFPLEADATISSEYILLEHFLDRIDDDLQRGLASYIRDLQGAHGGWALFYGGDLDVSASVKAYYALKLVGDDIDTPHMVRAREAILAAGGAARANVFTRYTLALFEQVPWRAVPSMPVELMLMPRWFPANMWAFSYWSRTVIAPLLIVAALKPRARNPRQVDIRELFATPPELERDYLHNPTGSRIGEAFLVLDRVLKTLEPRFSRRLRRRAIERALAFIRERLNGESGLGAIYPAMANAVMAFDALGYGPDDPDRALAMRAVRKLLTVDDAGRRFVQPCVSPVWDTALVMHALAEAGQGIDPRAAAWLRAKQILDVKGDWAVQRPDVRPGGWAFEYDNPHYPDIDDTALVGMALDRAKDPANDEAVARAAEWVLGLQSANGGWGAFDADNTRYYLNHIPFADHGALLDPPTADVTARCLGFLAQAGYGPDHPAVRRGIDWLRREQEPDGSWFGRWGTNYVYGTWSVLSALNALGMPRDAPEVRRAVAYLLSQQRPDGGWGEDGATYWEHRRGEAKASTPSQTAWALLGLMAAGDVREEAVARGVRFLLTHPRSGSDWDEPWYTAVGFPRIFYLRYHGYRHVFPLWALARYRNLVRSNAGEVGYGI